ncbi:MAG: riboflavin synthase [Candidatus Binatota bacterium]|nr:riboflavin synthase [Candidatus Binatota bacterium]
MFSGIVESVGTIAEVDASAGGGRRLTIDTGFADLSIGESVCVNGACLTVTQSDRGRFDTDVSAETVRRTTLGRLARGTSANLERSLRLGDRLSGHLVFGHVDAVGSVLAIDREGESFLYRFEAPPEVAGYLVDKGSVAVDGVSLTVFGVSGAAFTVAVIPHTAAVTTLGRMRAGDPVNLEADMIAKYVEKLCPPRPTS